MVGISKPFDKERALVYFSFFIFSFFSALFSGYQNPQFVFAVIFLSSVFALAGLSKTDSLYFVSFGFIFILSLFLLRVFGDDIIPFLSAERLFYAVPFFVVPTSLVFVLGERRTIYTAIIFSLASYFIHADPVLSAVWVLSSFIAIYSLRKVKRRVYMLRSGVLYGIFGGVLILLSTADHMKMFLFFFSSLFAPFISLSVLYIFERLFRVLTPFYLFDLQDIDHPLIVQLRRKAPGTFHHSIVVADISYVAAEEVGANAELVRCAALYHDIGKMVRPEYFIENIRGMSRHFKIAPSLSSKLVVKHVEDGVRLARAYRIPERIIDFIKEHHGTTYPEYFVKAAEMLNMQVDVRYPGPTPRSVETVIMMIADSSEAAVRSIEEYTVERISEMVDKVVEKKMSQGQFDNAPITLDKLNRIKEAIKKALIDFYHLRISYEEEKIKKDYIEVKRNELEQERRRKMRKVAELQRKTKVSDGKFINGHQSPALPSEKEEKFVKEEKAKQSEKPSKSN